MSDPATKARKKDLITPTGFIPNRTRKASQRAAYRAAVQEAKRKKNKTLRR